MWALATKQHKGHDNKYIFFIHFQGLNVALGLSILLAYNVPVLGVRAGIMCYTCLPCSITI
jgi:hypothetical protein